MASNSNNTQRPLSIEVRNRVGAISSITHALQGLGVNIDELHVGGEQDAKSLQPDH